ncbi:hypothetical protein [Symbiopectobacterium purcellii]|uniref:hypothetical protein n=1 Tax=Symbiopectobacterium purcellii TaxID=2871826 RepID=UPI003F83B51F
MASISTLYNITACAAGEENQDKVNKALSPNGLLECIINFFTAVYEGIIRRYIVRLMIILYGL